MLDTLVPLERPYPKLDQFLPFDELSQIYEGVYSSKSCKEKEFEFGLRALIQFMEDLSDRERERYLQVNQQYRGSSYAIRQTEERF